MHAVWTSRLGGSRKKAPAAGSGIYDEIIRRVLGDNADELLRARLLAILQQTYLAGGTTAAESLGIQPTVTSDGAVIRRLISNHTPAIVGINDTTRVAIREALYDVVQQGGDLRDQVAAVKRVFQTASQSRAVAIARTESGIFWHAGGRSQGEEAGARSHTWLSTRDLRVRESHREAEGQCRPLEQPYDVGGEPLMHPLDPSASPGNIINCRCTETFGVSACASKAALTYEQGTAIWKRTMRTLGAHERLAHATMRRVFREQRSALLAELARLAT